MDGHSSDEEDIAAAELALRARRAALSSDDEEDGAEAKFVLPPNLRQAGVAFEMPRFRRALDNPSNHWSHASPDDLLSVIDEFTEAFNRFNGSLCLQNAMEMFNMTEEHLNPMTIRLQTRKLFHSLMMFRHKCTEENVVRRLQTADTIDEPTKAIRNFFQLMIECHQLLLARTRLHLLKTGAEDEEQLISHLNDIFTRGDGDTSKFLKAYYCAIDQFEARKWRKRGNGVFSQRQWVICATEDGSQYYKDADEYSPDKDGPALDVYDTHSWKHVGDIRAALEMAIPREGPTAHDWTVLMQAPTIKTHLATQLQVCVDPKFPEIEKNRFARAFRNGILEFSATSDEMKFYSFAQHPEIDRNLVCCKSYDMEFDVDLLLKPWQHISCPMWTKILSDQGFLPFDQSVIAGLFGRLLYPITFDNRQLALFILGFGGTGKTTLGLYARGLYDEEDVATLSSNAEQKFGLEVLLGKLLWICFEVTERWTLPRSDTQSILSGDPVSIAQKFKLALTKILDAPGLLIGNVVPPQWYDNSGGDAMPRRLIFARFCKRLAKPDPELANKLKEEFPAFLVMIFGAYHALLERCKDKPLASVLPPAFTQAKEAIYASMNGVRAFIDQAGEYVLEEGARCSWQTFAQGYSAYQRQMTGRAATLKQDEVAHVLSSMGVVSFEKGELPNGAIDKDGKLIATSGAIMVGVRWLRASASSPVDPLLADKEANKDRETAERVRRANDAFLQDRPEEETDVATRRLFLSIFGGPSASSSVRRRAALLAKRKRPHEEDFAREVRPRIPSSPLEFVAPPAHEGEERKERPAPSPEFTTFTESVAQRSQFPNEAPRRTRVFQISAAECRPEDVGFDPARDIRGAY